MLAWLTAADFADLVTSYLPGTTLAVPLLVAPSVAASIDTCSKIHLVDQPQPLDESTAVESDMPLCIETLTSGYTSSGCCSH